MKAMIMDKYGSAEDLRLAEVDRPEPKADEVLIKVMAASINKADTLLMAGKPLPIRFMAGFFKPKNPIFGADVAGVVVKVGSEVIGLKAGDEVFGDLSADHFGSFAEYVCGKEKHLALKAEKLSFEESAALGMAAGTALQALRDQAKVKSGDSVLINGASGGVGTFAIQLAKYFGAEVTAVCSTSKLDAAKELGADHLIDYRQDDFTTLEKQYDVIIDIAGNHPLSKLVSRLKSRGRYVPIAFKPGVMFFAWWHKMKKAIQMRTFIAAVKMEDLEFLGKLAQEGKIKALIDKEFTLDELPAAIKRMQSSESNGKLVLSL